MKVYAVFYQDELKGIFSSLAKAKAYVSKHYQHDGYIKRAVLDKEYKYAEYLLGINE